MADLINLRRERKRLKREASERKAVENRAAFGRSKAEKQLASARAEKGARELDGAKLTRPDDA